MQIVDLFTIFKITKVEGFSWFLCRIAEPDNFCFNFGKVT